jgi:hypothetical protein
MRLPLPVKSSKSTTAPDEALHKPLLNGSSIRCMVFNSYLLQSFDSSKGPVSDPSEVSTVRIQLFRLTSDRAHRDIAHETV